MRTVEKLLEQARRLSPGSAGRRSAVAFLAPLAIPLLAALLSFAAPSAFAQAEAPNLSAAKLAEEFSDPLTTLPQIFTQDAYTPVNYGTAAPTNRVILRLLVPRLPEYSLLPFVQLVRPSFSLVTVPTGRGGATQTAFGDMQLFDLAVIPWPGKESGLLMGVGPVFVFPTATARVAGQGAWQVGPAFGSLQGPPGVPARLPDPGSHLLRLHVSQPPARGRPAGPTDRAEAPRARILREIR